MARTKRNGRKTSRRLAAASLAFALVAASGAAHADPPAAASAAPVLASATRENAPASPLGNDREAPLPGLPSTPPPPIEVPVGAPPVAPDAAGATTAPDVVVTAPEPRYVAPTRRDWIGRVWAPVYINEQGPFRLVLDTGASASAITAPVALALGLEPDPKRMVKMFGVTGTANVSAVRADSLRVGDVEMESVLLPIVADAFGGAEGVLGNHGLRDKRITIDFRRDRITIIRSKNQRAIDGMITIPVKITEKGLLVIPARVGDLQVKAIIDTGGQMTIGNMALRDELERRARAKNPRPDQVVGATLEVTDATRLTTPPISLGGASIRNAAITFGEMYIFDHWKLRDEPALLVGMDVLGLLDVLVIDYRRRELQLLLRGGSTRAGSYTG